MRAVVKGIEIEGTPAEIAALINSLEEAFPQSDHVQPRSQSNQRAGGDDEESTITADLAYRILRRIPLSDMQKSFLLIVKAAYPDWVRASQVQSELSWTGTQLGGVLGGLGRRLSATKGVGHGDALWVWKWDDDEGEYAYRLPSASVEALDRMGL
jgi:hypothetical protein